MRECPALCGWCHLWAAGLRVAIRKRNILNKPVGSTSPWLIIPPDFLPWWRTVISKYKPNKSFSPQVDFEQCFIIVIKIQTAHLLTLCLNLCQRIFSINSNFTSCSEILFCSEIKILTSPEQKMNSEKRSQTVRGSVELCLWLISPCFYYSKWLLNYWALCIKEEGVVVVVVYFWVEDWSQGFTMVNKHSITLSTLKLGLLWYSLYWTLVNDTKTKKSKQPWLTSVPIDMTQPFCLLHFLIYNLKGQLLPMGQNKDKMNGSDGSYSPSELE